MRNLQEQVKKAFCYQKFFWPFTVWINCYSDLKHFANSRPSASNFKSFSRSLEQFFLTVGQNNFGNKIPFPPFKWLILFQNIKHLKKKLPDKSLISQSSSSTLTGLPFSSSKRLRPNLFCNWSSPWANRTSSPWGSMYLKNILISS